MCDQPFTITLDQGRSFKVHGVQVNYLDVPCGKCPPCKNSTVKSWIFRLEQEAKNCDSAHFITLTYDDLYVPMTEKGHLTLRYKDFQDYMKRVRRKTTRKGYKTPVKMFCVGEYGSITYRPHFHAIIFNADTEDLVSSWGKGIVHPGTKQGVTIAAMQYILNYLQKPKYDEIKAKNPKWDGVREMRHMSSGLGANFMYDEKTWDIFSRGEMTQVALSNGKKIRLPRYYREKMYTDKIKRRTLIENWVTNFNKTEMDMYLAKKQGRDYAKEQRDLRYARIKHNSNYANKLRDPYATQNAT